MGKGEVMRESQQEESAAAPTEFSAEGKAGNVDSFEKKGSVSQSKPLPMAQKAADYHEVGESTGKPKDRDVALAEIEREKRLALIKAWEENEKSKADNMAYKKLSAVDAWENTKRASVEARLRQIEEKIEKKKAEYGEKTKNKMAIVHKAAEEKRALIEADRGKDFLMVEEAAAKFRARGSIPKKFFACFSS